MKTFDTLCRLRQHSIQIKCILAVLICCSLSSLQAQDFDNTGGTFRNGGFFGVRQQVTGLPDSIGGTFNYFGTNQQVPAVLYQNLILSGSGTKTTVGGNFTVLGNLTDSSLVTLNIQSGILTLGGTLSEQGYVRGRIQKSVLLGSASGTSDFGQIGSVISWMNRPLGTTLLIRSSGTASTGNGYQSIRRYYDVIPTVNNRLTATLVFKYSANELNSHNPHALELWRSTNNGSSWRRQGGVVDTANKTITKMGIVQFSRWTASDTSHLLGPAAYEWRPDSILYVAGDTQKTYRHKSLQQPLVVRLKDYFNNWLEGDTVDFGFAGNSKGATLSVPKAVSDSNGYASTTLTLGDSLGVYTVVASNSKIPGRTVRFNATAIPSRVAVAIQLTAGNNQPPIPIYTSLSPFVVTTVDSEAFPTSDDTVYFSIVSTPLNATGQSLSDTMVITDTIGQASTILRLGNKVGTYTIRAATSRSLIGSPITFTARAIPGPPTTTALVSGNNQVKQIGDTLINPLVLSVADTGGNQVDSALVKFAVASAPTGAQNYHLSADSVMTDSLGRASVQFILGTKPGFYTITATVANLTPRIFTERGFLLTGDANGDESYNVADITTLIDHIIGKKPLLGIDSLRADVNNDSVIDAKDIAFIRNNILNEVINSDSGSNGPSPRYHRGPELKMSIPQIDEEPAKETSTLKTQSINGKLEVTVNGLRFNLTNDIPVTGLQIDVRFEQNINIEAPELVFDRMRNMEVYIHSIGSRMHVIAYNLKNEPIDTGQGTLFRIPLFLSSTAQIDTIEVVLSTLDNNAISFPASISRAVPGLTYPAYYKLYQNYPNPFNHGTIIRYDVPDIQGRFAKILIQVFDILGREVKTLYLGEVEASFGNTIQWDGTDNSGKQMSSGIYFYRLISREHMSAKKMIYIK